MANERFPDEEYGEVEDISTALQDIASAIQTWFVRFSIDPDGEDLWKITSNADAACSEWDKAEGSDFSEYDNDALWRNLQFVEDNLRGNWSSRDQAVDMQERILDTFLEVRQMIDEKLEEQDDEQGEY